MDKFQNLGFIDWYFNDITEDIPVKQNLARIVTVNKDNFTLQNEECLFTAQIMGRLRYHSESKVDLPAVGDWVEIQSKKKDVLPRIKRILPRKTELKRKMAGRRIEYQMIATNINTAFIVQALDTNFNINRMERYLAMIHESNIEAIILLSKTDLLFPEELQEKIDQIRNHGITEEIITFSNKKVDGIKSVLDRLEQGKTYCLLGSSGVGKTSLINNIVGNEMFVVNEIREKDRKGRHTTTNRNLVVLPTGGMIIDTPGMRELGNIEITEGLKKTFNEIEKLGQKCKFKNCSHTQEPKCAVLQRIKDGYISQDHYENYMRLKRESEYNEMSYIEKRKKDKTFSKMVKQAMSGIKQRKKDS